MTGQHTVDGYIKGASSYTHAGEADPAFPRPALNVVPTAWKGQLDLTGITIANEVIARLREVTDTVTNGFGYMLEVTLVKGDVLRVSVENWEMLRIIKDYDSALYAKIKELKLSKHGVRKPS